MLKNGALKEDNLVSSTPQNELRKHDKETESRTVFMGAICPNCGARLEGRKCKLFCPTTNCGYLVTCSEW